MFLPTNISKKNQKGHGFTLVELLVVIGILGILAAGLLAAIDPLEQLKKGRDQNKRNIAVEYHNALTRYYATYGYFPWNPTGNGAALATTTLSAAQNSQTAILVTTGELKASFNDAAGDALLGQLSVTGLTSVAGGDVFVCFNPESKAVSLDPTTLFTSIAGATAATCPSTTDTAACFFCAR